MELGGSGGRCSHMSPVGLVGVLPSHVKSALRSWLSALPPEQVGFTIPLGVLAMDLSLTISDRQTSMPVGAMLDPLIILACCLL